jgi:hypothetical protein
MNLHANTHIRTFTVGALHIRVQKDQNLHVQKFYNLSVAASFDVIPLKTKRICFIKGLGAYRAVNTLHFGYKNQSLNVL